MTKKFKVLRSGISQRVGDGWKNPKVGELIEVSEAAAAHLLGEDPPFIAEVEVPRARPSAAEKEKEEMEKEDPA